MKVTSAELSAHIKTMIDLLQDSRHLVNDPVAQQAVVQIHKVTLVLDSLVYLNGYSHVALFNSENLLLVTLFICRSLFRFKGMFIIVNTSNVEYVVCISKTINMYSLGWKGGSQKAYYMYASENVNYERPISNDIAASFLLTQSGVPKINILAVIPSIYITLKRKNSKNICTAITSVRPKYSSFAVRG